MKRKVPSYLSYLLGTCLHSQCQVDNDKSDWGLHKIFREKRLPFCQSWQTSVQNKLWNKICFGALWGKKGWNVNSCLRKHTTKFNQTQSNNYPKVLELFCHQKDMIVRLPIIMVCSKTENNPQQAGLRIFKQEEICTQKIKILKKREENFRNHFQYLKVNNLHSFIPPNILESSK